MVVEIQDLKVGVLKLLAKHQVGGEMVGLAVVEMVGLGFAEMVGLGVAEMVRQVVELVVDDVVGVKLLEVDVVMQYWLFDPSSD